MQLHYELVIEFESVMSPIKTRWNHGKNFQ